MSFRRYTLEIQPASRLHRVQLAHTVTALVFSAAGLLTACSGHPLATASSEPGCSACSVLAESDSSFVQLAGHDDSLFVLDSRGGIASLSKASGALSTIVPIFSGALAFGVSATALAWVSPSAPSGTPTNQLHALTRDGSLSLAVANFAGTPALAVGLGDAFVGAYSDDGVSTQIVRYSLADGSTTVPSETLSDEEASELPVVAGSDTEVVWCRTHADASSSLWRLSASGNAAESSYPFSCADLWALGDGRVIVLDPSSGTSCYYRIDAAGQSEMLACTSSSYQHFSALDDGSVAFIADGAAARRVDTAMQESALFTASGLVGIQADGHLLYYATAAHVGSFAW